MIMGYLSGMSFLYIYIYFFFFFNDVTFLATLSLVCPYHFLVMCLGFGASWPLVIKNCWTSSSMLMFCRLQNFTWLYIGVDNGRIFIFQVRLSFKDTLSWYHLKEPKTWRTVHSHFINLNDTHTTTFVCWCCFQQQFGTQWWVMQRIICNN